MIITLGGVQMLFIAVLMIIINCWYTVKEPDQHNNLLSIKIVIKDDQQTWIKVEMILVHCEQKVSVKKVWLTGSTKSN